LKAIRRVVPSTFTIGIKLNSADHTSAEFEDTIRQIELIVEAGIDFLEISGGTYEDPEVCFVVVVHDTFISYAGH
jgi:2,4-dienoyl-CoA reductase-like NADH-dependent reductase (Old Yellow Enzyme family)